MAISKTLVKMMNGDIILESEPEKGTLLTITVPAQIAEAQAGDSVDEAVPEVIGLQPGQPEWRILVVDDNRENRTLLNTLLTGIGCRVKEAENGEERTHARVDLLAGDARIDELMQMLGAASAAGRQSVEEMLAEVDEVKEAPGPVKGRRQKAKKRS